LFLSDEFGGSGADFRKEIGLALSRRGVLRTTVPRESGEGAFEHNFVEMIDHVVHLLLLAAPPRRHRGHLQVFSQQVATQAGEESHEDGRFHQSGTERIGDGDIAGAGRLDESGSAEIRIGAQLERIAKRIVDPAQNDVDRLQTFQRF
jgi:hypothetical protein